MVPYFRPTRAEISLDALSRNIAAFRQAVPGGVRLMASVKANAYGHGAVQIAREAVRCGADYLGVAFLDEAIQLRNAGISAPLMVLGFVGPEGLAIARELNITVALFREDVLEAASTLPPSSKRLKVHIKIDTGMGRLGILAGQDWQSFIRRALQTSMIEVEGVFTHFACADEADKTYTKLQYDRFREVEEYIKGNALPIPIVHAGNSATGMDTPEWTGGMLRLGIGMYGLYPSAEVNRQRIELRPVLSLKTEIVKVKEVPPGWGISYGKRYVSGGTERIGTLPVGYADGYSRMLSGSAEVLVRGHKVPVRGTICMDQCMIALDGLPGLSPVQEGEEVILLGSQGGISITADDIAGKLGTLNYEVTCMLSERVPRVYIRDGQKVSVSNPLYGTPLD
ncbi:alanine racemase [Paenibacillus tarimensis]